MKQLTLSYLVGDGRLCLALKKRGFGEGNWNGYGGKLEEGETLAAGAVREIHEESGVSVLEDDLDKIAIINFKFETGVHFEVHVFFVYKWDGEPKETEEMRPKWFSLSELPYHEMWESDLYWLPRTLLLKEKLLGTTWFDASEKRVKASEWKRVENFE